MNKHPSGKTNIEENSYDWFRYGSIWSFFCFLIDFYYFTSFFFLAKEKGPKRTAPLGAGPVFP